jgi:cysteine desulfurase
MRLIYLDYNATTPIDPAVVEAMLPYLQDDWGRQSRGREVGPRPERSG